MQNLVILYESIIFNQIYESCLMLKYPTKHGAVSTRWQAVFCSSDSLEWWLLCSEKPGFLLKKKKFLSSKTSLVKLPGELINLSNHNLENPTWPFAQERLSVVPSAPSDCSLMLHWVRNPKWFPCPQGCRGWGGSWHYFFNVFWL